MMVIMPPLMKQGSVARLEKAGPPFVVVALRCRFLRLPLHFTRLGCLLLSLIFSSGCRKDSQRIEAHSDVDLPAFLISEIQNAPDRSRLGQCPVELINRGSVDREITLLRSGCSCYGVTLEGERLKNSQTFFIPAKKSRTVQIEFQPAESHSDKFYTAELSATNNQGEPQLIPMKCRQRVFADLRLLPATLTVDVDAIPEKTTEATRSLSIEHIYRAETPDDRQPEFTQLPEGMTVGDLQRVGPPEKIEKHLWKQTWTTQVQLSLSGNVTKKPAPQGFVVAFRGEGKGEHATARGNLMIHLRQSVVFPNRVNFGKFRAGTTRSRRILLTHVDENPFRIRFDQSQLPAGVQIDLSEYSDHHHFVTLSMTPQQAGPFNEVVKLQTDLYDIHEIAIRVEGIAE